MKVAAAIAKRADRTQRWGRRKGLYSRKESPQNACCGRKGGEGKAGGKGREGGASGDVRIEKERGSIHRVKIHRRGEGFCDLKTGVKSRFFRTLSRRKRVPFGGEKRVSGEGEMGGACHPGPFPADKKEAGFKGGGKTEKSAFQTSL